MIINGDALEELRKLPTESIDAIITDPPYCSGGMTESAKRSSPKQGIKIESETYQRLGWFDGDNMATMGLVYLLRSIGVEATRILKPSGHMLIFCDWRMYPHLAPAIESTSLLHRNLVVWDKNSQALGFGFRPQHELIMQFTKGKAKYYTKTGRNVISNKRIAPKKKMHPTQKPVELMEELIRVTVPEGGTVLDPFAGSGTTLVAAQNLGMQYIGIDRDARYIDVMNERLGVGD